MKKTTLIIIAFFTINYAYTQTNVYHAFSDSTVWRVDYRDFYPWQYPYNAYSYFHYYLNGDTLINGSTHKKIYRSYVSYDLVYWTPPYSPSNPPISGYVGALKDDITANKSYFVFPNSSIDSLLFDYNLLVGDTLRGVISQYVDTVFMKIVVKSVDSVQINGQYRKRWNFDTLYYGSPTYIIEGIGSSSGLFDPLYTYASGFRLRYLICVKEGSNVLFVSDHNSGMACNLIYQGINDFNNQQNLNVFPNPFSNQTTIQTSKALNDATLNVYNSFGQIVKQLESIYGQTIYLQRENLACGIYYFQISQDNAALASGKLFILDK